MQTQSSFAGAELEAEQETFYTGGSSRAENGHSTRGCDGLVLAREGSSDSIRLQETLHDRCHIDGRSEWDLRDNAVYESNGVPRIGLLHHCPDRPHRRLIICLDPSPRERIQLQQVAPRDC